MFILCRHLWGFLPMEDSCHELRGYQWKHCIYARVLVGSAWCYAVSGDLPSDSSYRLQRLSKHHAKLAYS